MVLVSRWITTFSAAAMIMWAGVAEAATTQPMIGTVGVVNAAVNDSFSGGPDSVGNGPNTFGTVSTSGRDITLPANQFQFSGSAYRWFPGLAAVAQFTQFTYTTQQAATFKSGGGAAASGSINFCPAIAVPTSSPPYQTGNFSCTNFASPGTGNLGIRIGINNTPGAPNFGGVLKLLRNRTGQAWFVPQPPTPSQPTAIVSKQAVTVSAATCPAHNPECALFEPGNENFRFLSNTRVKGPNYSAYLTSEGRVGTILGFVGTPTTTIPDAGAVGFRMTTGTISGSDIAPALNPPTTDFFFFSKAGTDTRTTTTGGAVFGNIVLVGGSVQTNPSTQSFFNKVTILEMRVPEPGMGLSLAVGVLGLVGLSKFRSRA